MKKAIILLLAFFLAFQTCFCSIVLELNNRLYFPQDTAELKITIEREGYIGTGNLKICLAHYDFATNSYGQCDTLLSEHEAFVNSIYSATFFESLSGIQDGPYRFCIKFEYKENSTSRSMQTCSTDNFILIKQITNQQIITETENIGTIALSATTPLQASPNSEVSAYVNITNNNQNSEIILYSFIKNQTAYINENLNDDSFKQLNITTGSSAIILLKNKLMGNISQGIYDFIIMAESGGSSYQTLNTIEIIANQAQEIPEINIACPECELCQECEITPSTQITNQSSIIQEGQTSKITAKLNLKRDEYYYIPAILIGIISLIIMYVKLK
jgi:hypothetical protein